MRATGKDILIILQVNRNSLVSYIASCEVMNVTLGKNIGDDGKLEEFRTEFRSLSDAFLGN